MCRRKQTPWMAAVSCPFSKSLYPSHAFTFLPTHNSHLFFFFACIHLDSTSIFFFKGSILKDKDLVLVSIEWHSHEIQLVEEGCIPCPKVKKYLIWEVATVTCSPWKMFGCLVQCKRPWSVMWKKINLTSCYLSLKEILKPNLVVPEGYLKSYHYNFDR